MHRAARARMGLSTALPVSLVVVLGAALATSHCSIYDASLLEPDLSRPASADGIGWWSGPGDRGCFSAKMPTADDRPAPQDPKAIAPIYLAFQSMRIGSLNPEGNLDPNAWKDLGYDLDGVCTGSETCEGEDSPASCKPTVPQIATDGNYCRDNTFGRLEYTAALVPELSTKYGLSDDAFNCALCVGDYNFLIKISEYNGTPNDDRVRVDLYPSPGLEKPLPWDCSRPDWKTHPCFTSDLPFTIQPDSLVSPGPGPDLGESKIFDADGYVKDGYIVMNPPGDTLFWFPGYNALVVAFPLRLERATVSGKLTLGADGVWRITDGVVAGRTTGEDVVNGFRLMGLCEADSNYSLMVDFVNKNLDVLAGPDDPSKTCDAMSLGIGFTALQARAGKLQEVEPLQECVLRGRAVDDGGAPSDADAGTSGEDAGADAAVDGG